MRAEVGRDLLQLGTVTRCFESAVRRWPERPVVAAPEGVATFRQLAARARMIAGCVRDEGGDPERPVLLFFEPGIQLVAAMLDVLGELNFEIEPKCFDASIRGEAESLLPIHEPDGGRARGGVLRAHRVHPVDQKALIQGNPRKPSADASGTDDS